jgi:predicted  nucleic acid-binding Zn-ribbon protein
MEIQKLLEARELLDAEITDAQTRDIKQEISQLRANSQILTSKLHDARLRKSTSDKEIESQLKLAYEAVDRLKNLRMSDIYFVTNLQAELNANGLKLAELTKNLREISEQN